MSDLMKWRLAAAIALLLAVFAFKGVLLDPPSPPERAAAGEFDTQRALDRLGRILGDQRPHSVDTEANDAVRDRLIAEIKAIGLTPEVHEATDCSGFPKSRTVSCSHVRNVVAVIPGANAPALLMNAHYDSTPTGPGAADDGVGVATLLEVGALLKRERLARPVILLFNEGEEYGLNGAAAFVDSDPLAKTVGKLINIEARGVSGPAFMFETDTPNGKAMADYAAASARPYANSLSTDFAKLIPNSTDVVKFKPSQWETLSYAIIGNETRYHSPGDTIAALDRGSLYHVGTEALAAARRLAGPDSNAAGKRIFTDIAGRMLISLPLAAGVIALAILLLVAGGLVVARKGWRAVGAVTVGVIGGVAAAGLTATLAGFVRAGDYWRAYPWVATLAVAATVMAAQAFVILRASHRNDRGQLRLASWFLILLVGAAASVVLPGAIIFFLIGPVVALAGILIAPRWLGVGRTLARVGAAIQLLMFAELAAQIEMTLIDGPAWATAPLVALAALPFMVETARESASWTPRLASLAAIAFWVVVLLMPRASSERPLAFTLDHVTDERTGKAVWAVANKQAPLPDALGPHGPWAASALPYNKRVRWQVEAPKVEGPRGSVTVIASAADEQGRLVRLQLDRAGADGLLLRFDPETPVVAMGLPGRLRTIDKDADKGPSFIRCAGRSCDGLKVDLLFGNVKPVTAMLIAQRFSAPPQAGPLLAARPKDAHPQYSPDSTVRISAVKL
jgi:hypothetical protein